jgi:hypothetical protein
MIEVQKILATEDRFSSCYMVLPSHVFDAKAYIQQYSKGIESPVREISSTISLAQALEGKYDH